MLKIAVCDDEYYFRKQIRSYIEEYLKQQQILFEIEEFSAGKEFLEQGKEMGTFQIVFLDISMGDVDGITVGKKIRAQNREMIIIYVTAYIDYSLEGYKVDALRYLLKCSTSLQLDLEECMEVALKRINYIPEYKNFSFREGEKKIQLNQIAYVESGLHLLEFHFHNLEKRIYTMYGTINSLESQLSKYHFVRVHQSFLANLRLIDEIGREKVTLKNKIELPLARSRRKMVEQTWAVFKGEL